MYFQLLNVKYDRLADGERDSYLKFVSVINFFMDFFLEVF